MELNKLEEYLSLKRQEAEITKKLNDLKAEFREALPFGDSEFGDIKVQRTLRTRIDLDKEQVLIRLGERGYKDCEKITEYEVLTVKRV